MVGNLLVRGMLCGVIAGLFAFGFARIFAEPQIDRAIAFEAETARAAGEAPEAPLVSRATQAGPGLFTGVVVYGAAMGGLLSLVFAYVQGRVSRFRPLTTSTLLGLGAFVAITLVPSLKYPANPPSVGAPDTIGYRTALFLGMLVISLAALVLAVSIVRRLWRRYGPGRATLIGGACFAAIIAIALIALPGINEVPDRFSPAVLWRFREASIGVQLILWAAIGLLFGALTERGVAPPFDAGMFRLRGRGSRVRNA
jgi:hypothetical protein